MAKCVIIVATHKKSDIPEGKIYLPLHVGREGKADIGFLGDNTGDNISHKNSMYSELTGLYWAWKNLDCEYLGLVHYRRHFSMKARQFRKMQEPIECVLSDDELVPLLEPDTVVVPKKRNYYIETIASHYINTMKCGKEQITVVWEILSEKYPEYISAYDNVMSKTSAHMFNMFIMHRNLADNYCTWLFGILGELEVRIDSTNYCDFDKRYIGRVSEMLFNVWLVHNKVRTVAIGRIDLWSVGWSKKIALFLAAKFLRRKYKESF